MSSSQKSNFSLVVYISRTKAKKNGEVPVLMKININGERVVLQLQRSIQPKDWDSKRAKVIGRSHDDTRNSLEIQVSDSQPWFTDYQNLVNQPCV